MDKILLVDSCDIPFTVIAPSPSVRESVDKTGHMILKGVPATILDKLNGNGRKYTQKEMKSAISKARKAGHFESRRLLCTANDHPEESYVAPINASHIVLNAYIKNVKHEANGSDVPYLMNDWLVLNTESGKNLQALVHAGASFGTSIRGLGQMSEDTKEVNNYDFLGCDGVGNPSAGTFASKKQFEVTVESASETLIGQVRESLSEGKVMSFNLQEKIKEFKTKHFKEGKRPEKMTQEITSDLLTMQREAVENAADISDLDALTNELYGAPQNPDPAPRVNPNRTEAIDKDIHNRALRELEATTNLATHLQSESKKLTEALEAAQKEKAAYEKVAVTVYEQMEKVISEMTRSGDHNTRIQGRKAASAIKAVQKEAHDVITRTEARLESVIRIGEAAMETAITLRRICDSMYKRITQSMDNDPKAWKTTKTMTAKAESLTRDSRTPHKEGMSYSDRQGWV